MSGVPQYNIPAIDAAAAFLRSEGYDIVSPAELDSPATRAEALLSSDGIPNPDGKVGGETWGDMLARDVRLIADQIGGIILLNRWWTSRGARLEAFVGLLCKKKFGTYYTSNVQPGELSADYVRNIIRNSMP
jgi:hypothetical protein